MSEFQNKAEELGGKAKEAAGSVSGDERLENEGKADQVKSQAKQGLEDAAQGVKEKADEVIGKFKK